MKKIRIVTFHRAHNYGAMLQSYALEKFLKDLKKYDVKILDYRNKTIENGYRLRFKYDKKISLKRNFKTFILSSIFFTKRLKRYYAFENFLKQNLSLTDSYTLEDLKNIKDTSIDFYITGSDQVWNPNITLGLDDIYTLNFGDKISKRFSYAASIGNKSNLEHYRKEYKDKLKILDNISVREETGKEELENILDKNVNVVLDPTFLLKKEEWDELIKDRKINVKGKYILAYYVDIDEEYRKILQYLSEKTGLKIVEFEIRRRMKNVKKSEYTKGPSDFINLIKNAEYIVTTSFHATVFSIIFQKKFFVIPHRVTGARMVNLLEKLNISDRIIHTLNEFKNIDYNFKTDYIIVNQKLEEERKKSIKYLNIALGDETNE